MYIRKFRILPILQVNTGVPTTRAASEDHPRQLATVSRLKIAAMAFLLTFDVQIFRSISRSEDKDPLSYDGTRTSLCVLFDLGTETFVTVASLDPSRPLPPPEIYETCTWPLRSYSDLSCGGRRVVASKWPVHGRFQKWKLPSRSASSSSVPELVLVLASVAVALVACLFEVCGRLSSSSDGSLPHVLVVVVSNGLSPGRAQEHVAGIQLELGRSVLEKLWQTVCCIPDSFMRTYFLRDLGQIGATRRRSVDVGHNGST